MYAILCNYAFKNDKCWPSHKTLARNLSCSVTSVKKYLSELVGIRLVAVRREQYRSSVYYMLRPDALACADALCNVRHEPEADRHQPENACTRSKNGYVNTLTEQEEEKKNPPLPPVRAEQPKPAPAPKAPPARGGDFSFQDFEKAWEAYPRKDDKFSAQRVFKQLARNGQLPSLPELLAAITRFMATDQWQKDNGRYVPYLSNFLAKQRWLDSFSPEEEAANRKRLEAENLEHARTLAQDAEEARKAEVRARLRPLFDAFTERFAPEARPCNKNQDSFLFGTWMHLCAKYGEAPHTADVPDGNTLSIKEFLEFYQRRHDEAAYRAAHANPIAVHDFSSANKTKTPVNTVFGPQRGSLPAWPFSAPEPLRVAV